MTERKLHCEKGQTMILIIFLLAILTILTTGLHELWQANMPTYTAARYGMQAFYLAQAGIERAKLAALNTTANFTEPLCADTTNQSCGYCYYIMYENVTPFPTCSQTNALPIKYLYNFTVTNIGGTQRQLFGRGLVLDSANTTLAARQINLTINLITNTTASVVADSWEEK
jgi:Tfp pilus assembly protein PilX